MTTLTDIMAKAAYLEEQERPRYPGEHVFMADHLYPPLSALMSYCDDCARTGGRRRCSRCPGGMRARCGRCGGRGQHMASGNLVPCTACFDGFAVLHQVDPYEAPHRIPPKPVKDFRPDLREVALRPSPEVEKQMARDRQKLNKLQTRQVPEFERWDAADNTIAWMIGALVTAVVAVMVMMYIHNHAEATARRQHAYIISSRQQQVLARESCARLNRLHRIVNKAEGRKAYAIVECARVMP